MKVFLPEELKKAAQEFYQFKAKNSDEIVFAPKKEKEVEETIVVLVYQCPNCLSVYDPSIGDATSAVEPGVSFAMLPANYCCALCDAEKKYFVEISKSSLGVHLS